jgi:hypothetical protein
LAALHAWMPDRYAVVPRMARSLAALLLFSPSNYAAQYWVTGVLAHVAVIAYAFGDDAVLISRYRVYSEIATLVTVVAALRGLGASTANWILPPMLACAAFWFWHGWEANISFVGDIATRQRNARDHYLLNGHGIYYEFPPQDFGDATLQRAKELGYFSPKSKSSPAPMIVRDDEPRASPLLQLHAVGPYADDDGLSVRGTIFANDSRCALAQKRTAALLGTAEDAASVQGA